MQSNRIRLIAVSIALAAAACHKRLPPTVMKPPIPPPDERLVIMSPAAILAPDQPRLDEPHAFFSALEQAEIEFVAGNYDGARRLYEDAFTDDRFKEERDWILFKLGMTYLLPSRSNWMAAAEKFKKLDEYKSPLKAVAQYILSQHAELEHAIGDKRQTEQKLKQLNTELELLKQIDAVNRRKGKRP